MSNHKLKTSTRNEIGSEAHCLRSQHINFLQRILLLEFSDECQTSKFFDQIRRKDLLIIDDFGLVPLEPQHRVDLMEIIENRHGRASTMFASQRPVASWLEVIGEDVIADAILDRLVHTSPKIELKGESLRKNR